MSATIPNSNKMAASIHFLRNGGGIQNKLYTAAVARPYPKMAPPPDLRLERADLLSFNNLTGVWGSSFRRKQVTSIRRY